MSLLAVLALVTILALAIAAWWFRKDAAATKSQLSDSEAKLTTATGECIRLRTRYGPILDVEAEITALNDNLKRSKGEYESFIAGFDRKRADLAQSYEKAHTTYEKLKREVGTLEENLEDISFGLYKPHFSYDSPETYKVKLESLRDKERHMIREGRAAVCPRKWSVEGSAREGERMAKQFMKLLLRAFNGECDAALANVSWNNITKMEERVSKACDAINKLGTVLDVSITPDYQALKLDEIRLTYEYEQKRQEEREEQRLIKDRIRDEEKAQREMEKAKRDAEEEEDRYETALAKARLEAAEATGSQLEKLSDKISDLEARLKEAHSIKERAMSRAQLTKSGNVYIISNVGSFGESVFKIGMTRRLDPEERIDELGDASVPFPFDIHAMIYSTDAPALEAAIHNLFASKKVNLVNPRKEFFHEVDLAEIERFAEGNGLKVQFTKLAEAREWRETLALRAGENPSPSLLAKSGGEAYPTDVFG